MMMFYLIFFMSGLISFSIKRKHLILMLLSLEFLVLSIYLVLFYCLFSYSNELFFSMIFLSFSVCESVLGLSILVSLMRTHGNDYFQNFNFLW
uniref:NADH-ubiquinone oxidoreductase chain 4L n=1 Tax=Chrysolagria sp. CHR01 TaxID=1205615 RepID=A0A0S2MP96_9CUCU|nr:NADH deshydrogenase subunit 4L [Chrysolagria sp. CHR01]